MPNKLAKKKHLNEILEHLWATIKKNFVHKYNNNIVLANTELVDGYFLGEPISVINNTNASYSMGVNGYSGSPSMFANANDVVDYIVIGMDDSLAIGDNVSYKKVGVVKKENGEVLKHIDFDMPIVVKENVCFKDRIDANKIIILPIHESWQDEVWFIVGATGMKWNTRASGMQDLSIGGTNMPNVGSIVLNRPNTANYIGQVIILGRNKALNSVVTEWNNLEHVRQSDYVNLIDYSKRRANSALNTDGTINPNTGNTWNTISVDVEPNVAYTFLNNFSNGVRCAIHDSNGNVLQHHNTQASYKGGWFRKVLNPHADASKFVLEFNSNTDRSNQLMLIKGDRLNSTILDFIYYNVDNNKIVIGKDVSHEFDPNGTNLQAKTFDSAIRELAQRPTGGGTTGVTTVNGMSGAVTLTGADINAAVGGSTKNVQQHMVDMNSTLTVTNTVANDNRNRINALEGKHPTVRIGDLIMSYVNAPAEYEVGGVHYLRCDQIRTFSRDTYPELATILGQGNSANFYLPYFTPVTDSGQGFQFRRYYYIVAKIL